MSGSRNRPGDWADENSPQTRDFSGRIRKMAIKLTSTSTWQVVGHLLLDGNTEVRDAEVFSNVGFYSRPKSSSRPDAIVLFVGGAQNPAVVASRDEDLRKAIVAALAGGVINEDETIAFNSLSVLHMRSNGAIEARSLAGTAVALATKDDLDVLRAAIASAVISIGAAGAATINAAADVTLAARIPPTGPWPNGTKKLKGE